MFPSDKMSFQAGAAYKSVESSRGLAAIVRENVKVGAPETLQGVYTKIGGE